MNSFQPLLLLFWLASVAGLGAGNPSTERWWVPLFGCLMTYGMKQHPIRIPSIHRPFLIGFLLWWLCLLIPLPESLLVLLQGSLGEYKLLLHTSLGLSTNLLAANPALHFFNGSAILLFYGLYLLLWQYPSDMTKPLAHSILTFAIFGIVQRSFGVNQIYGVIEVPPELRSPFFASFINGNHAAYFMICGLFVTENAYTKIRKWIAQSVLCIGIILCESRGGIGLGILGLLWIYTPHHRHISIPACITASIGGLYFQDSSNLTHGRWDMWVDALNLFDWAWMTGLGFGGFGAAYPLVKSSPEYIQSSHLHMEYIEWLLNTGILGSVVLTWVLWSLLRKPNWNTPWFGVIATLLVASIVDFPLQLNGLALFFVIALSKIKIINASSTTNYQQEKNVNNKLLLLCPLLLAVCTALAPIKWDVLNPAIQHQNIASKLRSEPLNPTILEQTLWNRVQRLEVDTTDPLEFSRQTKTTMTKEIEQLHPIIVQHAHFYRSNIEAQRLLARWYRRIGQYNDACRLWQRTWTLETPVLSEKRQWMNEGLACDPNLWLVLTTLPDDVELLLAAAKLLDKQKQTEATRFCLERAFELETPPYLSALYLTQWLIEETDHQRAWQIHRNIMMPENRTQAEFCSHQKNQAELMRHYQVMDTSKEYERLIERCGTKQHWQNRLWASGLKEGRNDILQEIDERVDSDQSLISQYWQLLAHGYALNGNTERACHWIERAFHNGHKIAEDHLSRCANGKPPSPEPQWRLQTLEQIDKDTK